MDSALAYDMIILENIALFTVYTVLAIYVMAKFNLHMDNSALVTIYLYIISSLGRIITMLFSIFKDKQKGLMTYTIIVDLTFAILPSLAIIYLTYEMRAVYLKL